MKMKRILAMLLTGVMAAGCLAGCAQNAEETAKAPESTAAEVSEAAGESSEAVQETAAAEETKEELVIDEPVTLSVFTFRQNGETNDANELWFFNYMEYWLAEQGYDVTFDVTAPASYDEFSQQLALMLGTDVMPDLVIGDLQPTQIVTYGVEDGILLDWAPYINEEDMPNLCAALEVEPDALSGSTCANESIYGLPYIGVRGWGQSAGNMAVDPRLFINKNWLEECGLEVPATFDDFMNMLRTFKTEITLEDGQEVVPLVNHADFFEKYLWMGLGFYGNGMTKYGTNFAIKDEEVMLPVYTDDYDTFIDVMKTCYEEGLISQDYFTLDVTANRGMMSAGVCGVLGDWMLTQSQAETFANWTSALPVTVGDNDQVIANCNGAYTANRVTASASTKYPELLVKILDYMYSDEGSTYYYYGPMQGTDPLNQLDGWYYNEDGLMVNASVEAGEFANMELYTHQYVCPQLRVASKLNTDAYAMKLAGLDKEPEVFMFEDVVTGDEIKVDKIVAYTDADADGYTRLTVMDAWENNLTKVKLPSVYLSEDEALRATELSTVINEHVTAESAKFITGLRPVEEIADFKEELKAMGIEEYIDIYKNAYSTYMESVFQ